MRILPTVPTNKTMLNKTGLGTEYLCRSTSEMKPAPTRPKKFQMLRSETKVLILNEEYSKDFPICPMLSIAVIVDPNPHVVATKSIQKSKLISA